MAAVEPVDGPGKWVKKHAFSWWVKALIFGLAFLKTVCFVAVPFVEPLHQMLMTTAQHAHDRREASSRLGRWYSKSVVSLANGLGAAAGGVALTLAVATYRESAMEILPASVAQPDGWTKFLLEAFWIPGVAFFVLLTGWPPMFVVAMAAMLDRSPYVLGAVTLPLASLRAYGLVWLQMHQRKTVLIAFPFAWDLAPDGPEVRKFKPLRMKMKAEKYAEDTLAIFTVGACSFLNVVTVVGKFLTEPTLGPLTLGAFVIRARDMRGSRLRMFAVPLAAALGNSLGVAALMVVWQAFGREFAARFLPASVLKPSKWMLAAVGDYGWLGIGVIGCVGWSSVYPAVAIVAAMLEVRVPAAFLAFLVGVFLRLCAALTGIWVAISALMTLYDDDDTPRKETSLFELWGKDDVEVKKGQCCKRRLAEKAE